jgi:hypothetical protein
MTICLRVGFGREERCKVRFVTMYRAALLRMTSRKKSNGSNWTKVRIRLAMDSYLIGAIVTEAASRDGVLVERNSLLDGSGLVLPLLLDVVGLGSGPCSGDTQRFSRRFRGRPTDGFQAIAEVLAAKQGVTLPPARRRVTFLEEPQLNNEIGVARFIYQHERGTIKYDNCVDANTVIARICLAFPRATIAIMMHSRDDAGDLQSDLRLHGVSTNERVTNVCGDEVQRVVVGTIAAFAEPEVEFEKRDLLLVPFAQSAAFEAAAPAFLNPDCRFRVFGFRSVNTALTRCEADHLIGIFGLDEIVLLANGLVRAPAYFAMVAGVHGSIPQKGSETEILRSMWRCEPRNRLIARYAKRAKRFLEAASIDVAQRGFEGLSGRAIVV